jgi:hypothetical protein
MVVQNWTQKMMFTKANRGQKKARRARLKIASLVMVKIILTNRSI